MPRLIQARSLPSFLTYTYLHPMNGDLNE
jgi:hypothetical protein